MQAPAGKAKILAGVRDRLNVGGKFLSYAIPELNWINTFNQAGLAVTQQQTGAMRLLDPVQVLQDEGIAHTGQIIWNVMTQPVIRDRILTMRRVLTQYQQDLGYIALCAVRES